MIPDLPAAAEQVSLLEAMVRLPLAAALGAALAMRPRRAGTPARKPAVVQTQVVLAVMGALILIVVGANLARAFGVVGIAGLIRYRAKVDDPKDASVMLAGLGVGLACGVGAAVSGGGGHGVPARAAVGARVQGSGPGGGVQPEGHDARIRPGCGGLSRRCCAATNSGTSFVAGARRAGVRRRRAAVHEDRCVVDEPGRAVRQGQGRRRVGRKEVQVMEVS